MGGMLGGRREGAHYIQNRSGQDQGQGLLLMGFGEVWNALLSTGGLWMKASPPTEEWGTGGGLNHAESKVNG